MPDKRDNDVPFHLPMEPGHEDDHEDIHKVDTEDILIPPDLAGTVPRTSQSEIARLHAEDSPLPPEDAMAFHDAPTVLPDAENAQYTTDNDVPFHLPKEPETPTELQPPPPSAAMTQPHQHAVQVTQPRQPAARPPQPTIQRQPAVQAAPPEHARYQRPAAPAARQAIPPAPPSSPSRPDGRSLPRRPKAKRKGIGCVAIFLGIVLTFCGGSALLLAAVSYVAYQEVDELVEEQLVRFEEYSYFQSTFIYDRNGVPLYEVFNEGRRTYVPLETMPDDLINATIAIEDDSFYDNLGIDFGATFVATLQYLGASAGENTPGGSTITQQLVRNVLFTPEKRAERSVERKVEEIVLAIALTARKDKDRILEMYLNEIYYGNLAYGAEAAAQIFFGKPVGELTLGEAAMLAGLPQAPAELDPLNPDPEVQEAVRRRWVGVLDEMVEEGYITQAERDAAIIQGLRFADSSIDLRAPHFTVYAQDELEDLMTSLGYSPEEVARGGLQVFTTVDVTLNDQVQTIAAQQVASFPASRDVSNAAVVVLKPLTGEILAMVGSVDYENDAIDGRVNVTTRPRQPGSTMKPFTYAAALELGFSAGDVIWDTRVSISQPGQPDYVPRNYDGSFHGPMRMRYALANSYNIPAVQTLRYVGVDYLLTVMDRLGVQSLGLDASRYGISLTLGGGEVTLLELTRAYATFANGGLRVDSHAILCVLDNENTIIYEYENGCPLTHQNRPVVRSTQTISRTGLGTPAFDERIAYIITDILNDESARRAAMGANSALFTPNIATSVKTGTTNDVKDNWTVGYTSNVAVGVWVGNNDGRPMVNTSGLEGAAPIWNNVMTMIHQNSAWLNHFRVDGQLQPDRLPRPAGLEQRTICDVRSLYDPAASCSTQVTEYFLNSPPRVPDGQGGMMAQPVAQPPQETVPTSGSYVRLVQPGIYQTVVMPLDPAVSQAIQFQVAPGEAAPPPPRYCRVPVEATATTPTARELLFIAPPMDPRDAVEAERYAQSRGLAFLPTIDCTPELLAAPSLGPSVVTAVITEPQANATVSGPTPIIGTAQFTSQQAVYYKLDIIGGQWGTWTTIADVSYTPVVNGQLGVLPALPSGSYRVRLVVVGTDGNHLQNPYEVPINVP